MVIDDYIFIKIYYMHTHVMQIIIFWPGKYAQNELLFGQLEKREAKAFMQMVQVGLLN